MTKNNTTNQNQRIDRGCQSWFHLSLPAWAGPSAPPKKTDSRQPTRQDEKPGTKHHKERKASEVDEVIRPSVAAAAKKNGRAAAGPRRAPRPRAPPPHARPRSRQVTRDLPPRAARPHGAGAPPARRRPRPGTRTQKGATFSSSSSSPPLLLASRALYSTHPRRSRRRSKGTGASSCTTSSTRTGPSKSRSSPTVSRGRIYYAPS